MDLRWKRLSTNADLVITSFVAARHPTESCGSNGLPLTPNSIAILGQSQRLKTVSATHPNLCAFLECLRGKHERIVVVAENFRDSLKEQMRGGTAKNEEFLLGTTRKVLLGLEHLHKEGLTHATLEPSNVLLGGDDGAATVKLSSFWLGHMTAYGSYVSFPIFNPRFAAPEVIGCGNQDGNLSQVVTTEDDTSDENSPRSNGGNDQVVDDLTQIPDAPQCKYDSRCDIWSLGMILACCALDFLQPWESLKLPQILRKVLSLQDFQGDVFDRIAREHECLEKISEVPPKLRELIARCLQPTVDKRPTARELLDSPLLGGLGPLELNHHHDTSIFPSSRLRCRELRWPPDEEEEDEETLDPMNVLTIQEVFYLWKLAGGDIFAELRKHGLMVTRPSILSIPRLVLGEGHTEGQRKERCTLYDPVTIPLSLQQLRTCLEELTVADSYPLLLNGSGDALEEDAAGDDPDSKLPLVIKEGTCQYQFKRVVLFRRLLQCYPYQRKFLCKEAKTDSTPHYRASIWAALLGIDHDTVDRYKRIDKEAWTPTDRQIEVDIPRCHQYNNLLSSPEGHRKFKRVLKAWVATNPEYVYWQGLDSLCAPFLYLNFNDEALAFACLSAFIPKYLYGMFLRDNAAVIQEYLSVFSHVQAFHDAELFNHLDNIGFIPDLYAIPWILTMFAHVFPLHNIFHLWDKLLLGDSAFPLCIGLAVLLQLRERLLQAEFNDCILLFSDLPAIDIEKCVKDSVVLFCTTPKSISWRKYGSRPAQTISDRSDLSVDTVTLAQQKLEKVPRMSGEELLELLGLSAVCGEGDNRRHQQGDDRVLVVDVRNREEYRKGTLPGSVHLHAVGAFSPEGQLTPDGAEKLVKKKGKIVCIVGGRLTERDTLEFATKLLKLNYNRVCVLHRGIEIFNSLAGTLYVPNS